MDAAHESLNATTERWLDDRRRELDSLIFEGLSQPEITAELKARDLPAEEVAAAIRDKNHVLTRFLAARRWSTRLGLADEFPGHRLAGALGTLVAYVLLMVAAFPRMPFMLQVFGWLGLAATCALAGRAASTDISAIRRKMRAIRGRVSIDDVFDDVVNNVILPEIHQYLVEHSALRYSTELPPHPAVFDSDRFESAAIVTSAGQHLHRLVRHSDTEAIAVAGPRGVGKTTTIRVIADGMFSDADEPPPLSVVSAAPSRYDARDFVLHLHAVLCRRVIGLLNAQLALPFDDQWRRIRWHLFRPWLIVAGFLALLFVTTRGFWDSSYPDFFPMLWGRPEGPSTSDARWPDPVPLLLLDVLRIAAGLSIFGIFVHFALLFVFMVGRQLIGGLLRGGLRKPGVAALREEAYAQLRRTRFLQTHTSGWSGKVGLSPGGDVGVSKSLQRAEQALTHPEVVDNFRRFAQRCADELDELDLASGLVIAIDELDKIAEPGQAHEFINDVKGVFGVRGCLFLVSVSEDAMAAFEQRGIPVRDAFDSAFTHMVRLDNFTLAESRRWLSRRLTGVPEQFTYLLHCLSGGLPRELLRTMNELVDVVREDDRGDLSHVTEALLERELDRKAHAFIAAARRFESSPELTGYLTDLLTMTEAVDRVELAHKLRPSGMRSELHRVRWQSAGYLLFVATMRETFVNSLDKDGLSGVARLAQARAHLAVDPQVAWQLLKSIRASRKQMGDHVA